MRTTHEIDTYTVTDDGPVPLTLKITTDTEHPGVYDLQVGRGTTVVLLGDGVEQLIRVLS